MNAAARGRMQRAYYVCAHADELHEHATQALEGLAIQGFGKHIG